MDNSFPSPFSSPCSTGTTLPTCPQDALEELTGGREMSAGPILSFFDPLYQVNNTFVKQTVYKQTRTFPNYTTHQNLTSKRSLFVAVAEGNQLC